MTIRAMAVLALTSLCGTDLLAQQNVPGNGERIALQLTGDLAKEYGRCTGILEEAPNTPGLRLEIEATVAPTLADGQLRIEHSYPIRENGKQARLVTLTATVAPDRMIRTVIPKGTLVFASPWDRMRPSVTTAKTRAFRVELSNLKGVTLRTWSLVEEIGK